jgi:predicted helicase
LLLSNKERTFIGNLLTDYYYVDDMPLGEKNSKWLQDDYVKFIRFAQWRLETTGDGILGFVTNHGYLDNPTFRGMRQSLMRSFSHLYVYDLHGNSKKGEIDPSGGEDKNVFDIQQGVAIILAVDWRTVRVSQRLMKVNPQLAVAKYLNL